MQYILHSLSNFSEIFIGLVSQGGYWVLSVILLFEALPVVGSFVPGHIVIIAAGFLVKLQVLNLGAVLFAGINAVIVGDIIGFLLGRRYGYDILYLLGKIFLVKKEYIDKTIEKTKNMIDAHTGKTIILGKFSPLTRPLTPFLVGAQGVNIRTFWIYNIIGGILWISSSVLVGYIFGASYHVAAQFFGKLMVAALVAIILIIWGFHLANTRFHIFKKYELFVLGLNVVSLWALAKTIQDSFSLHSFMSNFDIAANIFMVEHVTPLIAHIALRISTGGGMMFMLILGLGLGLVFLVRKKWRRAAIMFLSTLSTAAVVIFMKELFMRARPHDALVTLSDPSFPSGHASLAAAFFVALVYVSVPHIHSIIKREIAIVLCVLAVALIGISRVALNVHWASDVVAGWALGVFLATGSILVVRYFGAFFIKKQ